jgi:hypothetical protein
MHSRLLEIVAELQRSDKVAVTHFHVPEANAMEVKNVLVSLPHPLDDAITGFYRAVGGFQLEWIHKRNPAIEGNDGSTNGNRPLAHQHAMEDYFVHDGRIMIGSMAEVFFTDGFDAMYAGAPLERKQRAAAEMEILKTVFAGQEYTALDFMRRTKIFDLFSKVNDMAFFMDESANPPLVMGDDHQACYTDSRTTDFRAYVDMLCRTKGAIRPRVLWYQQPDGHQLPRLGLQDNARADRLDLDRYDVHEGFAPLTGRA